VDSAKRNQILLAANISFTFIGIVTVLLGPILPFLSSRFLLNDSQSGLLFVLQVGGSLLGTSVVSKLIESIGFSRLLTFSLFLMAIGIAGIGYSSMNVILLCVFLNGVGIGLTIPAMNLLVAELNPQRSAAALNVLNFAWGLGAFFCQPFVTLLHSENSITTATNLLALSLFFSGLCFLLLKDFSFSVNEESKVSDDSEVRVWRTPFAWLSVAIFFLYVGVENSIGGWLTTYSFRFHSTDARSFWAPATAVFWGSLLLGRIAALVLLSFAKDATLLLFSMISATIGITLLLFANHPQIFLLSVSVIGIGLAPVFPTSMARFTNRFGSHAKQNAAPIFIFATLGSATITWTVGHLSKLSGSLRIGLLVPLFCSVLMITLQVFLNAYSAAETRQSFE
jgi:fucose permease